MAEEHKIGIGGLVFSFRDAPDVGAVTS